MYGIQECNNSGRLLQKPCSVYHFPPHQPPSASSPPSAVHHFAPSYNSRSGCFSCRFPCGFSPSHLLKGHSHVVLNKHLLEREQAMAASQTWFEFFWKAAVLCYGAGGVAEQWLLWRIWKENPVWANSQSLPKAFQPLPWKVRIRLYRVVFSFPAELRGDLGNLCLLATAWMGNVPGHLMFLGGVASLFLYHFGGR